MAKIKKLKIPVLILAFIMIFSIFLSQKTAFAEETTETTSYKVWVQGIQVTSANQDDVLGNGTVKFTPPGEEGSMAKLTLNNAKITGAAAPLDGPYGEGSQENNFGIASSIALEIELLGENAITASDTNTDGNAICSIEDLVISGSGSLDAEANKANKGNSYGIYSDGMVTIKGGNIRAVGREAGKWSAGIRGNLVMDSGVLYAEGGKSHQNDSYGIISVNDYVEGVMNGGSLTALGENRAFYSGMDISSYEGANALVNDEMTAEGAVAWDGETPFTDYKYVKITRYFTVSFNAGGGEGSMEAVTVGGWESYTLPDCGFTAPENQEFKAWEVDGVEKAAGDEIIVSADTIVKALWKEKPTVPVESTLTFDFDGGTLDGKTSMTIRANKGDTIKIPPAPTKEGFEFDYWKGSKYYPGDSYVVDEDHTFTAVWKEKAEPNKPSKPNEPPEINQPEKPTDTGKTDEIVETGDSSFMFLWLGIVFLSLISVLLVARQKMKYDKK